ncbi:MAG: hypothetical protein FWF69_03730 [Firmicutes bacterium]|nr:hypothetical protein [Bacillota bacterium]
MAAQGMAILHTEDHERQNDAHINRMLTILGMGTLFALGLIAAALIWRDATHMNNPNETPSQIVVVAATLVWGSTLIFFWSMKLTPLFSYRRYLREIRQGLFREAEGVLVRFDRETTFRDGISFYAMIINTGERGDPEDERLLYWDVRLKRPEVDAGAMVRVKAHGNDIIGFEQWS